METKTLPVLVPPLTPSEHMMSCSGTRRAPHELVGWDGAEGRRCWFCRAKGTLKAPFEFIRRTAPAAERALYERTAV